MFHPSEPAFAPCATGPQKGTANLQMEIMERFPLAKDFGIFNCRPVRGGTTLSKHGKGRAFDVGFPLVGGKANPEGYKLVGVLRAHAWELGLETIIWNHELWSARWPNGRPYVPPPGGSPHEDHVHGEQITPYAKSLTIEQADTILGGVMLTPAQEALVIKALPILAELLSVDQELKSLTPPSNLSAIVGSTKAVRFLRGLDDQFDGSEF